MDLLRAGPRPLGEIVRELPISQPAAEAWRRTLDWFDDADDERHEHEGG
jgi:hypothetical protein